MENKKEIKLIPHEAIIEFKISGFFFSRMLKMSENLLKSRTKEEIQEALLQIQKQEIKEPWIYDLETQLIFINDCEKLFQETNQIKTQDLEEFTTNES